MARQGSIGSATGGELLTGVLVDESSTSPGSKLIDFDNNTDSANVVYGINARQPTNNFKVAAFSRNKDSRKVSIDETDGRTVKYHNPGAGTLAYPRSTPILEVWRHVYVERDTMSEPTFDPASRIAAGTVVGISGSTFTASFPAVDETHAVYTEDQFQGGTVKLYHDEEYLGQYNVISNTAGQASLTVTISGDAPANANRFMHLLTPALPANLCHG